MLANFTRFQIRRILLKRPPNHAALGAMALAKGVHHEKRYRLVWRRKETVTLPHYLTRFKDDVFAESIHRAMRDGKLSEFSLIDALHLALLFWRHGKRQELVSLLTLGGFGNEDHLFWRVAQALYEVERWVGGLTEEITAIGQMFTAQSGLLREVKGALKASSQLRLALD